MDIFNQRYWIQKAVFIFVTALLFMNCTDPGDGINYDIIEPLKEVIQNDLIGFEKNAIPPEVIDSIALHRAVAFGEMHTILEERELLAHLAIQLALVKDGIIVCVECPQAFSWVYNKLSISALDTVPSWATYKKLSAITDSIKHHNMFSDKLIQLYCIDANLNGSTFVSSLKGYADYLGTNQPLLEYAQVFPNSNSVEYTQYLHDFQLILEESPEVFNFSADSESIEILLRMIENELLSVPIRSTWNSDYAISFSNREDLIKNNADYYLRTTSQLILFYFGAYHVQKDRFLGSPIEWLGDYLHHSNEISYGNTISIVGIPLAGEIINSSNSGTLHFDLSQDSKKDDLLRIVSGIQTSSLAWLPFSDPIFLEEDIRVQYIYDGAEVIAPPKQQFDAFITFSIGTFVGW